MNKDLPRIDAVRQSLTIGNNVALIPPYSKNMHPGVLIRFTAKGATINLETLPTLKEAPREVSALNL